LTSQRLRLMIPGPVGVEDDVLAALAQPVLPHYGQAWLEIYHETLGHLKRLFGTENDIVLMVGPGSAGLDSALGSLMRTGEKVLVPQNGFFGQRLGIIGRSYGLDVQTVQAPSGHPLDPDAIRHCLSAERDIQAVAVVHLETSTGVLNPLEEIVAVANEFEVLTIVDAVSSLGGMPVPVDEWGIDVCVTVGNKCLAGPAGLVPLSVSQRAWDQMERKGGRAHGWYLNLRTWRDYAINWATWHPYPTTLPTNTIVALLTSLRRILAGGLEPYYDRHVEAARTTRTRLAQLGFEMLTPEAHTSPLITTVRGLPGMDIDDFRRYLVEEWQIMIAGGLDDLRGKIFRVGHIGQASSMEYTDHFLDGVEGYLRLQGYDVPPRESGA
jgi:alanine-glyoxylate transaminase/serine-glyoxylate transaminase/serine-pyruvate transaminase